MNDEKKPFTVTDRRHFTAEGQSREDGPAQHPEPTEPEATEAKPTEAKPAEAKSAEAKPAEAKPAEAEAKAEGAAGAAGSQPEVTLAGFLAGLAAQAGMLMGMGAPPDSDGEAPSPDLDSARHVIGILEMLKDKTEGKRTPEEDRVFEAILYELRMAYVHKSGQGAA